MLAAVLGFFIQSDQIKHFTIQKKKKYQFRDFPGTSPAGGMGSIPGQGTKIPQAVWRAPPPPPKKKKNDWF